MDNAGPRSPNPSDHVPLAAACLAPSCSVLSGPQTEGLPQLLLIRIILHHVCIPLLHGPTPR
eukprot:3478978-Pyramimonas_sp.AAC.1